MPSGSGGRRLALLARALLNPVLCWVKRSQEYIDPWDSVPNASLPCAAGGALALQRAPRFARMAARPTPAWGDHFALLAAVRTDAPATAAAALGEAGRGSGAAKLVALGDAAGRLYLFGPRGELAAEYATGAHLNPKPQIPTARPSSWRWATRPGGCTCSGPGGSW